MKNITMRISKSVMKQICLTVLLSGYAASAFATDQNPLALIYSNISLSPSTCLSTVVGATDYMVPMDDQKDSSESFIMKNISYRRCGDSVQVKYELPQDLTGAKNVVRMAGSFQHATNTLELSGPQGQASCVPRTDGAMKCDVKFQKLELNPGQAAELLNQKNLNSNDLQKKLEAVGRFSGNPVGFFTVYPPVPAIPPSM